MFRSLEKLVTSHKTGFHNGFILFSLGGLYLTTRVSYLLFHSLAELFSIVVASALFLVAWNSREFIKNQYLLFIGIAYFFIAFLDLLHTLSYKGMPIFTDYDYYANQLWIGARYLESISLVLAFYFHMQRRTVLPYLTFALYSLVTAILVASIFWWRIFPECFVDGQGLTSFKKNSEYVICLLLIYACVLLIKNRHKFEQEIFRLIFISIIFTILSELAFTFYISNYGFSNLVGHYFKLFSFFLIYKAIIKTGIQAPYSLIFRELESSNNALLKEISIRKKTEKDLRSALDDIKTLSGIIPICSYCKNIRDDAGYWQQVEQFIHDNSDVKFTHSICPMCYEKETNKLNK